MKNELEKEDKIYSVLGYDKCGLQLAENIYLPDVKGGSKNLFYVGGIGSGKTASIIMPNILTSTHITPPVKSLLCRGHFVRDSIP